MRKCENENIKVLQQSQGTGLFRIQKTFIFRDLRALRARFFSHFRSFFLEKRCFFKVLWVNELCQQESMSHLYFPHPNGKKFQKRAFSFLKTAPLKLELFI